MREAALAAISKKYRYSGFVNIVEEPEENLYPASQKKVLYSLLSSASRQEGNELVITTHSPYMISFLTLAIKAGEIRRMGGDEEIINKIVPLDASIHAEDVSIYQLGAGYATLLGMVDGLPSDSNDLNNSLMSANQEFDNLLDIEDEIR